jgi:hypothetical protein
VASPAFASAAAVVTIADATSDNYTTATTKSTAATNDANVANELVFGNAASDTRTVVEFDVEIPSTTTATITVNAAGGVRLLTELVDADDEPLKSGAGTTTLTGTDNSNTADFVFYAYTNSTTAGSVTISANGNSTVYYVKGTAGAAYNIVSPKFPTSVLAGTDASTSKDVVSFKLTDVFGNELTTVTDGVSAGNVAVTALNASDTAVTYSTTRKVFESTIHSTTSTSVAMSIDLNATDLSDLGFPKPVETAFSSVSSTDLATQVAALTAQVATLKANRVTKKRYNTLARKWNAAFPSQKVALKK